MSENTELSGLRIHRSDATDPAIPQPSRKWLTRVTLPMTILMVALALLGYAARDSLRPAIGVRTIHVTSKSVTPTAGTVTVQAPGWVEADPFPIYVPALAPGVVKEVLVLEGESVAASQVVARLIDDDARLALEQAQAQLADRQARLAAAQSGWDFPIELDRLVAVGQATVQQVSAERSQVAAEIVMHEAKLAELEDKHQRLAALLPESAAEQQVVQAGLRHDAQQAVLELTQKKLDVLDARHLIAQANFDAAQEQRRLRINERRGLDQAQAGVRQGEVMVAQAALRLQRMEIRSPARGVVMTRLAVPGSKLMLNMDSKLSANAIHLYDPNKLQVRVDVPLADAAQVGIDQKAEITVDVLPEIRFTGRVTRMVHEADIQKNTLEVKVAIHNPTHELKPEMLARVKFLGQQVGNAEATTRRVFVPEKLLQQRSQGTAQVWLITAGSRATMRDITLGTQQLDGWVETLSGLNPGDTLVAESLKELKEGQRVRPIGEVKP
ncbi:efflux RND transporter periplasmic adaptor subunit [Planctomycetota bacterium]